jgi:uncharacterized protein YciI
LFVVYEDNAHGYWRGGEIRPAALLSDCERPATRGGPSDCLQGLIGDHSTMAEWIYFIHPPREEFAGTMTDAEQEVWSRHWERIKRLYLEGSIVLVGPTLGRVNTGLCIFEAPDEDAARSFMNNDPAIAEGVATGELRSIRVSLLRGRVEDLEQIRAEAAGRG